MKTFKYLSIAFLCLLALAGCVKETTDWEKGIDKEGAQAYIDNLVSTFYVKTAEEKAEEQAKLDALTKVSFKSNEDPVDDDHISLPIIRKVDNGDSQVEIVLTLPEDNEELFSVATVSYKKDGADVTAPVEVAESEEGLDVKFTFPAGVTKIGLDIAFDINEIESNKSYEFKASFAGDTQVSNYGANSFDFSIVHSALLHDPWVVIGKVKFNYQFVVEGFGEDIPDYNISIAIYEHDFTDDSFVEVDGEKVINPDKNARKLKDQPYYRFCIPCFLYQMVAASLEEGDGTYEEEDLEYAKDCDGIMFYLDKNYNFTEVLVDAGRIYPDPLCEDVNTADPYTYFTPLWSYHTATGTCDFNFCADYYYLAPEEYCLFFNPGFAGYWDVGHSAQQYRIYPLLTNGGSPYTYGYGYDFEWLSNDLVPNWDSYFTVDYNNDIEYTDAGTGVLTSEYKGTDIPVQLRQGFDELYKNDVYYIPAPYAEGEYGIALLVKDGKATLAAEQPIFEESLGKEVFVSQSSGTSSKVEFNEKGEIVKITLGMKIHYKGEDNAIMEVTEVYTPDANTGSIDDFLGNFIQNGVALYFDTGSEIYSEVNISKIEGNKVAISGLVDETFGSWYGIEDNILVGEYNPNTNQVIIPAQYFRTGLNEGDDATAFPWATEYDEEGNPLNAVTAYAYFQPGEGDYDAYAPDMFFSYISNPSTSCALTLEEMAPGIYFPVLTSSPYATYTDAYQVDAYYFDAKKNYYDSAASQELVCDDVNGPVYGTLGAAGGAYVMLIPEAMYSTSSVSGVSVSSVKAPAPDGRPTRFDRKNARKTDARFTGSFDVKNKIRL